MGHNDSLRATDALPPGPANMQALSPVGFLERSELAFADRLAVAHGPFRLSYRDLAARVRRLASALYRLGVRRGDTVSVLAPNVPAHIEAHFAIPMLGATINSINLRLDAATIGYILQHGESRLLLADSEYLPLAEAAVRESGCTLQIIEIGDPALNDDADERGYGTLLASGDPQFQPIPVEDEWLSIALNYTSGTTGTPKGVLYHHRGAYLNALGGILAWQMPLYPVYLWTLPMFHCNGWCFPWAIVAQGGTQVCLRAVRPDAIAERLAREHVTHLCGAPVVLSMLADLPGSESPALLNNLQIMTAGAPPPPATIKAIEAAGAEVTHVYGLTEVYGPAAVCVEQQGWKPLPQDERARLKARQGLRFTTMEAMEVMDPATMQPVPSDGTTLGEIMFRGNSVMKGYLKNPEATAEALRDGWFHSGDLAVRHPDGYVEIRDRSKDIIISGGENISSVEIEAVLYEHPAIQTVAVVARPDKRWGETPCAFVQLRPNATASEQELIDFCRERLASFKLPHSVVFGEVPTTPTGKIQKFQLRERARAL